MDTGHDKNVANLETTIIILTALGAEYAPSQPLITIVALQNLLAQAKAVLTDVDTAEAAKTIAVDEVQAEFKDLDKYAGNIKSNAEIELNDAAFTADLQTIVNSFAPPGRKTGLPDDPLTPEQTNRTRRIRSRREAATTRSRISPILSALLK